MPEAVIERTLELQLGMELKKKNKKHHPSCICCVGIIPNAFKRKHDLGLLFSWVKIYKRMELSQSYSLSPSLFLDL